MKRLIFALAIMVALLPALALAQAATLRVTADRTSLRDKAATDGAVIATVVKDEVLQVLEASGPWFKVKVQSTGREGYVHSLFVERVGAAAAAPEPVRPAPAAPAAAAPAPVAPPRTTAEQPVVTTSSASPTDARQLGFGLSILGDNGGFGAIVDYFSPIRAQGASNTLGWVVDASVHRKGFDGFGADYSVMHLLAEGGVRLVGTLGDNLTWHAQGLGGIIRSSFSGNGFSCGSLANCSDSDTSFIVDIGGAVQYALGENRAVRGQLDIPIGDGGNTTRFSIMYVLKLP